jgi:MoaA/NifB/PqqE/SkfB family radical SAM enzyme
MMYSLLRYMPSIFWKRRPIQLTFFVTKKCNARCPFCFYLKSADQPVNGAAELSLAEIERLAPSLGRLLWLAFSGGEIYLRKDLVEISRVFYERNNPAIMLYPTNGLLPELIREKTEKILEHCRNSVIAVKLSIDGVYSDHDALRETPGGFDKAMRSYDLLEELLKRYPNFELGINTVFCSRNQDKMDEIIDFVSDLKGVRTHTISLVRGNLEHDDYKDVDIDKYQRAIRKLERNLKARTTNIYSFKGARLKAAQDILQRRLIGQTLMTHQRKHPCYAGRLNLVMTESGEVYPCEILNTTFGNIREHDYDMKKLLHANTAPSILSTIAEKRCYCTHECNFITNILFNPRMYPGLLREYLQL